MRLFSCILIFFAVYTQVFANSVQQQSDLEAVANAFRQQVPYGVQVITVTEPDDQNQLNVIISEVPDHVRFQGITDIFHDTLVASESVKFKVGTQGWVADLILRVQVSEETLFHEQLSQLHRYLFGHTYKATAYVWDGSLPNFLDLQADLDLSVPVDVLQQKVFEEGSFQSSNGQTISAQALFEQQLSGIFYDQNSNLVLWSLPRDSFLEDHWQQMAMFTYDTDLVFGALGDDQHVLIVGRHRQLTHVALPPLSLASLVVLGGVPIEALYQSFQRNQVGAGRMADGLDWCPVLLSPELEHTEVGMLMIVIDAILKSATVGPLEYENIDPLFNLPPVPFKNALDEQVTQTGSLRMAWQNFLATLEVHHQEYQWVTPTSGSSLPLEYEFGDGTSNFEAEGFTHFASLNHPYLIRMTQYHTFFQIFKTFGIQSRQIRDADDDPRCSARFSSARKILLPEIGPVVKVLHASTQEAGYDVSLETFQQLAELSVYSILDPSLENQDVVGLEKISVLDQLLNLEDTSSAAWDLALSSLLIDEFVSGFLDDDPDLLFQVFIDAEKTIEDQNPWIHTSSVVRSRVIEDTFSGTFQGGADLTNPSFPIQFRAKSRAEYEDSNQGPFFDPVVVSSINELPRLVPKARDMDHLLQLLHAETGSFNLKILAKRKVQDVHGTYAVKHLGWESISPLASNFESLTVERVEGHFLLQEGLRREKVHSWTSLSERLDRLELDHREVQFKGFSEAEAFVMLKGRQVRKAFQGIRDKRTSEPRAGDYLWKPINELVPRQEVINGQQVTSIWIKLSHRFEPGKELMIKVFTFLEASLVQPLITAIDRVFAKLQQNPPKDDLTLEACAETLLKELRETMEDQDIALFLREEGFSQLVTELYLHLGGRDV